MQSLNNSAGPHGPAGPTGSKGDYLDFGGEKSRLLTGEWALEAYENGKVNKSTVLEFKTQRNLAGNYILSGISTVNFYEAGYSLSGTNGIKITDLSMTEIGGPAEDLAFEKRYFERLATMSTFSFKDNRLVLRNTKGEEMVFK
ncbi:META domain protein [compost metagenome]